MIELRGITWNHTRGYLPMVGVAQRYEELHPEMRITWEKRSLQAFADAPHRGTGGAVRLAGHRSPAHWPGGGAAEFWNHSRTSSPGNSLTDQASHQVGTLPRHLSLRLATSGRWQSMPPRRWPRGVRTGSMSLRASPARHLGGTPRPGGDRVCCIVPAIPIDSLMNFYALCRRSGRLPCLLQRRKLVNSRHRAARSRTTQGVDRPVSSRTVWNTIRSASTRPWSRTTIRLHLLPNCLRLLELRPHRLLLTRPLTFGNVVCGPERQAACGPPSGGPVWRSPPAASTWISRLSMRHVGGVVRKPEGSLLRLRRTTRTPRGMGV